MRCVRCNLDSNYKSRTEAGGLTCPGCKGTFAFEPHGQRHPFTDAAFQAAILRVSSNGRVRWGVEHLYYELCRTKGSRGMRRVLRWLGFAKEVPLGREAFDLLWRRWVDAHGTPEALIVRQPPRPLGTARPLEPDIPEYSFDRAVICDRARTVDLLIANDFHLENNCAVLSIDGYPPHAFDLVLSMLKKNPRLVVFALHDATLRGCGMAHELANDPKWFRGQGRIVDVGLRPGHAPKLRGLWQRRGPSKAPPPNPSISPRESAWLAQWALELAAVKPEQVIKRLFKAITAHPEAAPERDKSTGMGDAGGGDLYVSDVTIFTSETGTSDGGGDSFG